MPIVLAQYDKSLVESLYQMTKEGRGKMREVRSIIVRIGRDFKSMAEIITTHRKNVLEILILVLFLAVMFRASDNVQVVTETVERAQDTIIPEQYAILHSVEIVDEEQEEIRNEIFYGELEQLAILVYAEAGNQDELGKRYVADVVLNRMDDEDFPDTIEGVIHQDKQFSCILDGNYAKAEWNVTEDCFQIALDEYESRTDSEIEYFRTEHYGTGVPAFKHGDHYFSK